VLTEQVINFNKNFEKNEKNPCREACIYPHQSKIVLVVLNSFSILTQYFFTLGNEKELEVFLTDTSTVLEF